VPSRLHLGSCAKINVVCRQLSKKSRVKNISVSNVHMRGDVEERRSSTKNVVLSFFCVLFFGFRFCKEKSVFFLWSVYSVKRLGEKKTPINQLCTLFKSQLECFFLAQLRNTNVCSLGSNTQILIHSTTGQMCESTCLALFFCQKQLSLTLNECAF
jgi:hypothetical protein